MRSRFPILAVLSILTILATACGAQPTPAFVVSSTPVPGYNGTPLATSAVVPNTGGTATAMPPASTQPPSGGAYGGGAAATQSVPNSGSMGASQLTLANNAKLGSILVDGSGRTLYLLTKDTPNTPSCYAACAQTWPPLLASSGSPNASSGVDAARVGTAIRTDGTTQVTFNGWPLYYYSGDTAPGDANGQGINGVWFAVSPDGSPMK